MSKSMSKSESNSENESENTKSKGLLSGMRIRKKLIVSPHALLGEPGASVADRDSSSNDQSDHWG